MIRKFEFRNSKFEIPQPLKGNAGFTLVEVIIVITLIGAVAGLLVPPLRQGLEGFVTVETRAPLISQARQATTRMVREMRNIRRDPNLTPPPTETPKISTADANTISFEDVEDNVITFALSGSTVNRNSNALVDHVSDLQFRYFDGGNIELTSLPLSSNDIGKVRRILVILTLQDGGDTVTVTGQAFLRALTGV